MHTCFRTVGYLGEACLRLCVSMLVGATLGLVLGPVVIGATMHYAERAVLGASTPCCAADPGRVDYAGTLRHAVRQLQALPQILSEASSTQP